MISKDCAVGYNSLFLDSISLILQRIKKFLNLTLPYEKELSRNYLLFFFFFFRKVSIYFLIHFLLLLPYRHFPLLKWSVLSIGKYLFLLPSNLITFIYAIAYYSIKIYSQVTIQHISIEVQ